MNVLAIKQGDVLRRPVVAKKRLYVSSALKFLGLFNDSFGGVGNDLAVEAFLLRIGEEVVVDDL
ncbi:hypothetical protein [Trueperella pyogenes]|uniref:hypothetical protein n=1 Tax=Trueperella pyogenes TaxID=1661 RepID=UPI001E46EE6A|nr:hypothetical protein [Trueperella pyogenes]WHU58559.1 hypothetical protein QEV21_07630 [Trueperella pyogenes]